MYILPWSERKTQFLAENPRPVLAAPSLQAPSSSRHESNSRGPASVHEKTTRRTISSGSQRANRRKKGRAREKLHAHACSTEAQHPPRAGETGSLFLSLSLRGAVRGTYARARDWKKPLGSPKMELQRRVMMPWCCSAAAAVWVTGEKSREPRCRYRLLSLGYNPTGAPDPFPSALRACGKRMLAEVLVTGRRWRTP